MRQSTKAVISVASIGLIAASYKFGLEAPAAFANAEALAQVQNQTTAQPNPTSNIPVDSGTNPVVQPTPAEPVNPVKPNTTPVKPAQPSNGAGTAGSGSGNASSGTTTSGNTGGTTTASEVTKTGASIRYRFGTIQVSVTKTDGQITAVNLLQAGATGGRDQAFDFLVQYTLDAQGSSFGNISSATYTVDAYKQSLNDALAQF